MTSCNNMLHKGGLSCALCLQPWCGDNPSPANAIQWGTREWPRRRCIVAYATSDCTIPPLQDPPKLWATASTDRVDRVDFRVPHLLPPFSHSTVLFDNQVCHRAVCVVRSSLHEAFGRKPLALQSVGIFWETSPRDPHNQRRRNHRPVGLDVSVSGLWKDYRPGHRRTLSPAAST